MNTKRNLSATDRATLMIDTGLKPKSKDNFYPREDGESYSIKIVTPKGQVFYGMSYFGDKAAQQKRLEETRNEFPSYWKVEVVNG